MPDADTVGLLAALLATVSVAFCAPSEEGVNVTVTVLFAPATSVKLGGETVNCASLDVMPVTDRSALPVLVTVNVPVPVCPTCAFPMETLEGLTEMPGAGIGVPLPDTETDKLGSSRSLLDTVSVPDCDPAAVGLNATVTIWLAPAATVNEAGDAVNLLLSELMLVTDRSAFPVLVVVNRPGLLCTSRTSPKLNSAGLTLIPGTGDAVPFPDAETVPTPACSVVTVSVAFFVPTEFGVNVTVTS